jgi:RHS repeat-associated protein
VRPLPASPLPVPQPPPTLPKRIFLPLVTNNALTVDGQPAQVVKYYLVGGQRIASRTGSTGAVTYYYHDQLGSTIASSGGESTRYWPYGTTRSGGVGTAYQFTGQRREAALGLYFYNARWYDPLLGRFVQPDPLVPEPGNPQALNRYSYVLENPIKYRDPTGHWIETAWDVLNIGWDIAEVKRDPSLLNWGALVVDVAAVIVPAVPAGAGLIARGGKTATKLVAHGDEAVDAVRAVTRAADGVSSLRRFMSAGTEIVPDVLKAFGDERRILGTIPDTLKGRRVTTLGRATDTAAAKELGERILDLPQPHNPLQWSLEVNHEWLQAAIQNGDAFYLASPVNGANLLSDQQKYGAITVFARELDTLLQAGYRRVGDYLIPPR